MAEPIIKTDDGVTVVTGNLSNSKNTAESVRDTKNSTETKTHTGADVETTTYNDGSFEDWLKTTGMPDYANPVDKAATIRRYLDERKKAYPAPEKPEDEIARLNREKKWSTLGELFGKGVGLFSDLGSAVNGGIVPRRDTKIDTTKQDALIAKAETDYKNRLAQYHKDMAEAVDKYGTALDERGKVQLNMYKDWLGRAVKKEKEYAPVETTKTETGSKNVTKKEEGEKEVMTAMNTGGKNGSGGWSANSKRTNFSYTDGNGKRYHIAADIDKNRSDQIIAQAIKRAGVKEAVVDGERKSIDSIITALKAMELNDRSTVINSILSQSLESETYGAAVFNALKELERTSGGSIIIEELDDSAPSVNEAPSADVTPSAGGNSNSETDLEDE